MQKLLTLSADNIPEVTRVSLRTLKDSTAIDISTPITVIDWAEKDYVRLNLLADTELSFTGASKDGQQVVIALYQADTVVRHVTYDSSVRLGTDIWSFPALSHTVGKLDRIVFIYDSVANKYDLCGYTRGF